MLFARTDGTHNGAGTRGEPLDWKDGRRGGEPYINQIFMMGGGGPASSETDGMHYFFIPVTAGLMYRDSIEIDEQRFPILVQKMQLMEDSTGHGRRRGGQGTEVVMGPRKDAIHILHVCNGLESAPIGVRGGTSSKLGENVRIDKDGKEHPYPAVMVCDLEQGELLRARDQGGGGYGPPVEREPERVLKDVENHIISEEIARSVYGVAIAGSRKDDTLKIDFDATEELRTKMVA